MSKVCFSSEEIWRKECITVFTCDWCQQDFEGLPVLLATTGLRLSGKSEHECVCEACADLADSEELIVLSIVTGFHLSHDAVASMAA